MGQAAGIVLDLRRWSEIKWLGEGSIGDTDWALQDGIIFGWSESNVRYESAWWLNEDGSVDYDASSREHIENIIKDRPFNTEWLNAHPN